MKRPDSMPHDVLALLADERRSAVPGAALKKSLLARIESEVGLVPPPRPSQPPAPTFGLPAFVAPAVLAVAGALAVFVAVQMAVPARHVAQRIAQPEARAVLPPLPPPVVKEAPLASPVAVLAPARPSAAPPARPSAPPPAASERWAAERELIASARGAIASGDTAGALAALARHPREFPHGRLAEEREALRVLALARAGRTDEARAAADRFVSRWPRSIQRAVVDAATASIP